MVNVIHYTTKSIWTPDYDTHIQAFLKFSFKFKGRQLSGSFITNVALIVPFSIIGTPFKNKLKALGGKKSTYCYSSSVSN